MVHNVDFYTVQRGQKHVIKEVWMAQENPIELSESKEMYLITVYRLTRDSEYASVKDIAERLGFSPPSVSERVKDLTQEGYLIHEWRQGVKLSDEGLRIAIPVLRKHRIIETFLVRMAGYALDEVHAEACQLEHAISERLVNQLENILGYPQVDPHGHPIPTPEGIIPEIETRSLADVSPGEKVRVSLVNDWNQEQLSYLQTLELTPGIEVLVVGVAPFDGPVTLQIGEKTVALARSMARRIGVVSSVEEQQ
jgi:DtxR family Mn-dependent transcriptional regulator